MITKQKFLDIISKCPEGFHLTFDKWSHMDESMKDCKGYRGMPNRVNIEEIDRFTRLRDEDGKKILVVTFQETWDDETYTSDEVINMFCGETIDFIDFRLEIEDNTGKSSVIELIPEDGDIGHSDKHMLLEFNEII